MTEIRRQQALIQGLVQGVGFRPFIHRLAMAHGLSGWVRNNGGGVELQLEGPPAALEAFWASYPARLPPLARPTPPAMASLAPLGGSGFAILPSSAEGLAAPPVGPDTPPCPACLAELADPANRRFGHPFISCLDCGPRYTLVYRLPYDRHQTSLAPFALCPDCQAEYENPASRRFHHQAICCNRCGPVLSLLDGAGRPLPGGPLEEAARLLLAGGVVALKGLGGYQLACLAQADQPVARLRAIKGRPDKPLAVMAATLEQAQGLVALDEAAQALLQGAEAPILLLKALPSQPPLAPAIAPGLKELGVMLPSSPLHRLLLQLTGRPLVMTSANLSGQPILHSRAALLAAFGAAAPPARRIDAVLTHNRAIAAPCDDGVYRQSLHGFIPIRRGRGQLPTPLPLALKLPRPTLALGGELKAAFCLAWDGQALLAPPAGGLEQEAALAGYIQSWSHHQKLLAIGPQVVAHDLHPAGLAQPWAHQSFDPLPWAGVQHHHAHAVACMAEHGLTEPVLAVVYDGLGWGPDATLWGGELLLARLDGYQRLGRWRPFPLAGGDAAARQPWRSCLGGLLAAGWRPDRPEGITPPASNGPALAAAVQMALQGLNSPYTSAMGRLFDGAAALLTGRLETSYEGQAAMELEQLAEASAQGLSGWQTPMAQTEGLLELDGPALLARLAALAQQGQAAPALAYGFHQQVAQATAQAAGRLAQQTAIRQVVLSGGVFQNRLLLELTGQALGNQGLVVYSHLRVPPNDGGLALGQAVAGAFSCV